MSNTATDRNYFREWYLKNRERCAIRRKQRYLLNRDAYLQQTKVWHKAHPERVKQYHKKYYEHHKEEHRARCKSWRLRNLEHDKARIRAKGCRYYAKHRERIKEKNKLWHRNNPVLVRIRCAKRRALKRRATVNLKAIREWTKGILGKRWAKCYCCNRRISTSQIHFDHIVPLSKGGLHSIENLCVSCPSCNLSKNAKPLRLWVKVDQTFLEL